MWVGPGRAVWVSHPGQVAGRGSGEAVLCGSVRAGQYGRAGQGSWGLGVIIAGLRFGISGGGKKGETIAVRNMEFE